MICNECSNYARSTKTLISKHHPECSKYDIESDAKEIIDGLLNGIISWASDEDGVHPECCDAYDNAALAVGRKALNDD